MGLSLSMDNKLIVPVAALPLFCISCISTSDDSGDISPNETDSKVQIKTTNCFIEADASTHQTLTITKA